MKDQILIGAPWLGVDESVSRKLLGRQFLSSALNMVVRDGGKLSPRPGYAVATELNLASAPYIVAQEAEYTGYVCRDHTNRIIFASRKSGSNYVIRIIDELNEQDIVYLSATEIGPMACNPSTQTLYFVLGNSIHSITYAGTSDTTLVADARNGSGVAPTALTLDLVSGTQRIYWATSRHAMRSLLNGSSPAAIYDGGATDKAVGMAVDPANNAVIISDNVARTIVKMQLDGSSPAVIKTFETGWITRALDFNSAGKIFAIRYKSALPASRALVRMNADGSGEVEFQTDNSMGEPFTGIARSIDVSADGYAYYALFDSGEVDGTLFKMNIDTTGLFVASACPVQRSLFGVEDADGIEDFVIFQIIDPVKNQCHYAVWRPSTGTTFMLQNGYYPSKNTSRPNIWVTCSRDAVVGPEVPVSISAFPATYQFQRRGFNTQRGGVSIIDGGSRECENVNLGVPVDVSTPSSAQDEIQTLDFGVQSPGDTWCLRADSGTTEADDCYHTLEDVDIEFDPDSLKTWLASIFGGTTSDFIVSGVDVGGGLITRPFSVQFTGENGDMPMPLLEVYDNGGLTDDSLIIPTERTQAGMSEPGTALVDDIHVIENVVRGGSTLRFVLRMYTEMGPQDSGFLFATATEAELLAALAEIELTPGEFLDPANLIVTTSSFDAAPNKIWGCTVQYTRDYSGRIFNQLRRIDEEDL